MPLKLSARIACAVLTLVPTNPLFAANAGFLKDTALAYLTDEDRRMQTETALSVLDDANATSVKAWQNPKTGSSGRSESLGNFRSEDGLHCRKLRLSTTAKGIDSLFSFPVCRSAAGEWFIASGKRLTAA
jgi:hypothetical protein